MTQPQTNIPQQMDANIPSEDAPLVNPEANIEAAVAQVQAAEAAAEAPAASPAGTDAPATPEQAAAFELPAELAPTAPTGDPNALTEAERADYIRLQQGQAAMQQFRAEQEQAIDIQQRTREYESRNIDPETAQYIAAEVRAEHLRGQQRTADVVMQAQIVEGRRNAATYFGKQYGVAASALVGFSTPQDMEQYAKLLSYTGKMDKRVAKVEQQQVPEQHFDAGQAATGGPRNMEDQINHLAGDVDMDLNPEAQARMRQYLGLDT